LERDCRGLLQDTNPDIHPQELDGRKTGTHTHTQISNDLYLSIYNININSVVSQRENIWA